MAEHERASRNKQAEVDQKRRVSQKESQPLFDKVHAWELDKFSVPETPFQPRMDEHTELLSSTHADEAKSNLLINLQRTYGNGYVQRLMKSIAVQPKLTINAPNDIYEQEADKVADTVSRTVNSQTQRQPEEEEEELQAKPILQRQPEEEEEELQAKPILQRQAEEEEEELQAKPVLQRANIEVVPQIDSEMEGMINAARSKGEPLHDSIRVPMEQAIGADFSGVKTHRDSNADILNQSLQARAFTTGQDIFFRSGEYNPQTSSGQHLMAHELTHVVQQTGNNKPGRTPWQTAVSSVNKKEDNLPPEKELPTIPTNLKNVKPRNKKAPPVPTMTEEAPSSESTNKRDYSHIKPRNKKAPPVPTVTEEAPSPEPTNKQDLSNIKPRSKKAPLVPKDDTGRTSPVGGKSPLDNLVSELNKKTTEFQKGAPLVMWDKKTLEERGGQESGIYDEIGNQLNAYRTIELEKRTSKALEIRKLIEEWQKRNILVRLIPFWKRNRRKALTELLGLVDTDYREQTKYDNITYYGSKIKDYCSTLASVFQKPESTKQQKELKIDSLKYQIEKNTDFLDIINEMPQGELKTFTDKIVNSVKDSTQVLEAKVQESENNRDIREGEFQEWVEKEAKTRGIKNAKPGEASLDAFGHLLEALDPKHRDFRALAGLYQKWLDESTKLSFFTWVTAHEGKEENQLNKTRYLTNDNLRKKYKLGFKGLQPYYIEREPKKSKGQTERKELENGIYVMTPDREFYARREDEERKISFHHSSFMAGLPVGAAGVIEFDKGELKLDLESGHYVPTMKHMVNAVKGLKAKSVPLEKVMVRILDAKDPDSAKMYANDFLDGLSQLKKVGKDDGIFGHWMETKKLTKDDERISDAIKAVD
jgi:hypothetical protein